VYLHTDQQGELYHHFSKRFDWRQVWLLTDSENQYERNKGYLRFRSRLFWVVFAVLKVQYIALFYIDLFLFDIVFIQIENVKRFLRF
jgi:hypothetical protein